MVGMMAAQGGSETRPHEGNDHDATALTMVRVVVPAYDPGSGRFPVYQVVQRYRWSELQQAELYKRVKAQIEHWQAWRVVVDATGLGAVLASFLEQAYPGKVRPFVFTQGSKSQLGWDFIAAVETGRFKDRALDDKERHPMPRSLAQGQTPPPSTSGWRGEGNVHSMFWSEVRACEGQVLPGPGRMLRWGVPDGRRDPASGVRLHDDLLVSAALCVVLDKELVGLGSSVMIPPEDPFKGMRAVY